MLIDSCGCQAFSDLLGENDIGQPIVYSEHLTAMGSQARRKAFNWEGIVSKNADAPHRSDRNEGWLKVKTVQRQFPVIGFVKDPSGVAAPRWNTGTSPPEDCCGKARSRAFSKRN